MIFQQMQLGTKLLYVGLVSISCELDWAISEISLIIQGRLQGQMSISGSSKRKYYF